MSENINNNQYRNSTPTLSTKKVYTQVIEGNQVNIIKGKVVNILDTDKNGNYSLIHDPKVVIGQRKGFLVAIGILKKEKYLGIIDEKGNFIQDKPAVNKIISLIKGKDFADSDGHVLGKIETNRVKLYKGSKIILDDNIVVDQDGKFTAIEKDSDLLDQYNKLPYKDILTKIDNQAVLWEDSGKDINTEQGRKNLDKKPLKSTLKGHTNILKKATEIGEEVKNYKLTDIESSKQTHKPTKSVQWRGK